MRRSQSIVRKATPREGYQDLLTRLAKESGIQTPTREDVARLDKKRKNKASNDDWQNLHDPDAKITHIGDGTDAPKRPRSNMGPWIWERRVTARLGGGEWPWTPPSATPAHSSTRLWRPRRTSRRCGMMKGQRANYVAISSARRWIDKGYHSKQMLVDLNEMNIRSYASEPDRGRQKWKGDDEAQGAVYTNRRRIKGRRGKRLLSRRGEFIERSPAYHHTEP